MAATQRPGTQEALIEPSGERPLWKRVPPWFLIDEEDRIIPAALQRYMADRARAQRTIAVEGASHAIAVSRPDATVHPILEAAALHVAA
jgi:pimeloyl-ACP methyl ester carboxylesterase